MTDEAGRGEGNLMGGIGQEFFLSLPVAFAGLEGKTNCRVEACGLVREAWRVP